MLRYSFRRDRPRRDKSTERADEENQTTSNRLRATETRSQRDWRTAVIAAAARLQCYTRLSTGRQRCPRTRNSVSLLRALSRILLLLLLS